MTSTIAEELRQEAARLDIRTRLDEERRIDTDRLCEYVRHGPLLEALFDGPLDRRDIEAALGVSRATSHRFTRWLEDEGLATKVDGEFALTGQGEVIAEEILRFELHVAAAQRLAPLLSSICENHKEFVIEPFADATVTTADPADPYRPVRRFVSLVEASATLRGFNTTAMAPLTMETFYERLFEEMETEFVYLPNAVDALLATYPEQAGRVLETGRLTLFTREALPYGLALFDDRVGIGGYDEETGLLHVFVDTDASRARDWAEQVYDLFKADSDPLEGVAGLDAERE
ncbi:helix-turn-helix transcriptional regulator [Halomarina ordinaria]|uniref:Helix-turn-helix transcriptional regulator n=1 Tax=Halomarina ordinaria TaxID=3033939 RepID=A0ABD5UGZ7_9EURY|nr:MarR family transcriptional regulator [Halomarina sp. PSRA2]